MHRSRSLSLTSFSSSRSRIKFVVVAEPPEDKQTLNCVDVGYATVNAKRLLENNSDYVEGDINGK